MTLWPDVVREAGDAVGDCAAIAGLGDAVVESGEDVRIVRHECAEAYREHDGDNERQGAAHNPGDCLSAVRGALCPSAGDGNAAEDKCDQADYDPAVPWWDPEADASVSPDTDSVMIGGQAVARGSLVRLRPGARRADAQDMFLAGRVAEVQAVLLDVEDQPYLAVALTDHPDPDLSIAHGRFLYFMPDEVEPCEPEGAP